jgi:hypothetical protein
MEQRASQLIGLMAHCGVRAGQTQPRSGRRNWRSLLPLFEIACVLMSSNHVACFVVNANHGITCERLRNFASPMALLNAFAGHTTNDRLTELPLSSPGGFPKQRSLEDQFSGLSDLQERGRCRRTLTISVRTKLVLSLAPNTLLDLAT